MDDLGGGMHTGISSTGAAERDFVSRDPAQRLLQGTLYRVMIRLLRLPAVIEAALIGNDKRDATSRKRLIAETF
ncbi:hypothetical protein GCM10022278_11970 [Allohahella marinimesophila]|uniref:Uncharacterized protein n=1 Tax=Allohahella marinimesophila TaxID=1054972 RepID=A0ABP7NVJ6_9GAMM